MRNLNKKRISFRGVALDVVPDGNICGDLERKEKLLDREREGSSVCYSAGDVFWDCDSHFDSF